MRRLPSSRFHSGSMTCAKEKRRLGLQPSSIGDGRIPEEGQRCLKGLADPARLERTTFAFGGRIHGPPRDVNQWQGSKISHLYL